ncbi:MAG: hypothetical protein PSV36_12610 [Algoriphagus sp.]|nr:hypothetical protein [Algoriphagus sp.]
MKKISILLVFGILGIVPIASAEWFASMEAHYVYNYSAGYDPEISIGAGSIGLGSMSASATLAAISYECDFALSTCDQNAQRIVTIN